MYKDEKTQRFMSEFELVKKKENISQRRLSELIGMSPQTITQLKNGKQSVQEDVLKKFAEMYEYDLNIFYGHQKNPEKLNRQIEDQFDLIKKNNEMLIQLFQTGIELTNSQIVYMKNLKTMIQ